MYSKIAMDTYQEMLEKVGSEESLEKTAGKISNAFSAVKNFFTKGAPPLDVSSTSKKILTLIDKGGKASGAEKGLLDDALRSLVNEETAGARLGGQAVKGLATASLLGIPTAAVLGKNYGKRSVEVKDDWDKAKYGLTGLAVGLSAPVLYNALTGGKDLSSLAAMLGNNPNPSYSDFTSI